MEVKVLRNEKDTLELEFVGMDTSLPQLLVSKLSADKSVEFAAFKKEHPIVGHPKVIVKTKKKAALDLVLDTLDEMASEVEELKKGFKNAK